MSLAKRRAILGVVWLIIGVWFGVSVQVWVGIAMFAVGVAWLGLAMRSKASPAP